MAPARAAGRWGATCASANSRWKSRGWRGWPRVGGINLFERADVDGAGQWRLLTRNTADGTQTLRLAARQLPELLSVVAVDNPAGTGGAPGDLSAVPNICRRHRGGGAGRARGVLMDANGQRFWLLADDRHWPGRASWIIAPAAGRCASPASARCPRLRNAAAIAATALERLPRSIDRHGAIARWDEAAMAIVAVSHLPGGDPAVARRAPAGLRRRFRRCALCGAGRAPAAARPARALARYRVADAGFPGWRIAADPAGGVWLLERASGRLGRLSGCVQPARPAADYAPATFRPDPENPSPPTLRLFEGLAWPAGERPQRWRWRPMARWHCCRGPAMAKPAAPARSPARHARGGPDPGRCGLRLFDRLAQRGPCRGALCPVVAMRRCGCRGWRHPLRSR